MFDFFGWFEDLFAAGYKGWSTTILRDTTHFLIEINILNPVMAILNILQWFIYQFDMEKKLERAISSNSAET